MTADAFSVAPIVAAPFVGSFLAVAAIRLPQGRTAAFGRSACDACGVALGPLELIPLLSFALQRGRCRHCGARIDPLHPLLEAAAPVVAVWAGLVASGWIVAASCVLGWALLALSAIDWRTGFLPDVLTLPLVAAGLGVAYAIDPDAWLDHGIGAAGGFLAFAALSAIYRFLRGRDGLGLGDAKLLAASGAWLSWSGLPTTVLYAAFIGLALAFLRCGAGQALKGSDRLAFGPALAVATWLVWLYGPLVPR